MKPIRRMNMDKVHAVAATILQGWEKVKDDPEFKAEVHLRLACPSNVSRERYGVAIRKAHDMLHAHRDAINSDTVTAVKTVSTPVLPPIKQIIIIATNHVTRDNAGSKPVKWRVHPLRYSKGYVAITHDGRETASFPTVAHLQSAINKSGWRVLTARTIPRTPEQYQAEMRRG